MFLQKLMLKTSQKLNIVNQEVSGSSFDYELKQKLGTKCVNPSERLSWQMDLQTFPIYI